jgi:uncharacterized membrane protein
MNTFVSNMDEVTPKLGYNLSYFKQYNYTAPKEKMHSQGGAFIALGILFVIMMMIFFPISHVGIGFLGFLLFGLSSVLAGLYIKSQSSGCVLLTNAGEEEYRKWRGLYEFLKSDTLINERTVVELPLWERYLVYATAFGISEKVIKAIQLRCPIAATETEAKSIVHNTYLRSNRIHIHGRSFHRSVQSSGRSYHAHSGGFSSGGTGRYYGGGGRGGGGGGGGH